MKVSVRKSCFSPIPPKEGIIAAAGGDNTVTLWRRDGTFVKTLRGHTFAVKDVAFSPDGQMLVSGGDDNTIKLWKQDGTLLQTFQGHQARVWSVDVSRDGQIIASASGDTTVKLWQPDGSLLRTLKGHNNAVWGVAISPIPREGGSLRVLVEMVRLSCGGVTELC